MKIDLNENAVRTMLFWKLIYDEEVRRVVNVCNNWRGFRGTAH